jgi:uncharacterized protein YndB with AHSA1/START domain
MDLTPKPPIPVPSRRATALAAGLGAAVVLYCSWRAVGKSYSEAIFCSPFLVGIVVGLLSPRRPVRNGVYTILAALALAVVTLREGVVCTLFALPLVMPETVLGALCGATVRRHVHSRRARARVAAAIVLLGCAWQAIDGAVDDPARHPLHQADAAVQIAAPPERVFAALTARALTVESRWPWFLRVGLPMPSRFEIDRAAAGAPVRATFSQGVAEGHVTELVPGRSFSFVIDRYAITDLPFHITRLGRGPHFGLHPDRVDDWLTLVGVRYQLEPTGDGGTRLLRRVTWRRHLAPAFYFAWLQQAVMDRGQRRLLDLIRARVEGDGPPAATDAPAVALLSPH